ncbi:MarR family winged helix-turn-helix transcriptional regulator [Streptomyces sp. NPDC058619]|uniref:MarR family winged helix-turn-helix transcriptional regulator n=1 Tax=unclassified Streptomyces TaxID=2593676 RepID=UPI00365175FF
MPIPAPGPAIPHLESAHSIGDVAELLDVLYENARHTAISPVSATQLRLMCLVDRRPGLRMRALAQLLGTTGPSMTRLCDRLEAAGFLRRHPCPGDGREVTLRLTPAGERHLAQAREAREHRLARALDTMTPDNRRALTQGLEALKHGITATAGLPTHENRHNPAAA